MPAIAVQAQRTEVLDVYDSIVKYATCLCHRYHVRPPDSDDLVQEALTAIAASSDTYQSEKGPFDKWARGVTRNIIYGHLRKTEQFLAVFSQCHSNAEECAAAGPTPESSLQQMQAQYRISSAVDSLSDQQFQVLTLRAVDGKSHREIAAELGISVSASEKCYQRVCARLAQCVTEEIRCALPLVEVGCNESSSLNDGISLGIDQGSKRIDWDKWSHYLGQIAAAFIAFWMFAASNPVEHARTSITGKIPTSGHIAMYRIDKQDFASDKPTTCSNVPLVKPEPAPSPSVRVVSAPTMFVGKPTPVRRSAPEPSFTPTVRPVGHRQPAKMQLTIDFAERSR